MYFAVFQSSSNCQCGSWGVVLSTEHSMQLIINSLRSCELCQHIVTASMSCSLLPAPCFLPPAPFTVFCALWGHLKADIQGAEVCHRIKLVSQLPVRHSGRIIHWRQRVTAGQRCKKVRMCEQCLCKMFPSSGKIWAKFYAALSQKWVMSRFCAFWGNT